MKTFLKICSGILVLGVVLTGAGLAAGGRTLTAEQIPGFRWVSRAIDRTVHHALRNTFGWLDDWDIFDDGYDYDYNYDYDYSYDYDYKYDYDYDDNYDRGERSYSRRDVHHAETGAESIPSDALTAEQIASIRKIELELGDGEFYLQESDSAPYTVDGAYFKTLWTNIEDGTWKIRAIGGESSGHHEPIFLYLPAGLHLDDVEIDLGAGYLSVDTPLTCNALSLDVGAGNLIVSALNCPKTDVEVGAGKVSLSLAGAWQDYGYRMEAGLGMISVNGDAVITGVGEANRAGSRMLDIEVGAGSVELFTAE